ncbi:hypothetical protein ACFVYE_32860 [Streptomyces sp. NPDC058239]|uniref:hypothetical protein n=1 Tax=Streptomyces sp. NPDC058239 TaxID=3346395 RepID=UPI0036F18FC1
MDHVVGDDGGTAAVLALAGSGVQALQSDAGGTSRSASCELSALAFALRCLA